MTFLVKQDAFVAALAEAHCDVCGTPLECLGAHGIGCPTCADVEIDALDAALDTERCPCCLGSRKVIITPDSGCYVVRPADQDDPRAADCPCDGTYDRWAA